MDLRTRIEDLYNEYQSGNNYLQITRSGTDYVLAVSGSFYNRGRYKFRIFDQNGNLKESTGWIAGPDADSRYSSIFGGRMFPSNGVDLTPIFPKPNVGGTLPPHPPPLPPGPAPGTGPITNDYSVNSGYGEIDLRRAIEAITGNELTEVDDQIDNAGKVRVDTGGRIIDQTITRSGAIEAHAAGYRGQSIIVAVIDTGVEVDHEDLDGNIWVNPGEIAGDGIDNDGNGYIDDINGWNTAADNNDLSDLNGHGTHVAGIIAAEDNGIGRIGVAPDVKIMVLNSFRRLNGLVSSPQAATNEAIYYAVDNGADVINLSLGSSSDFVTPQRLAALKYAEDNGVICVIASGNDSLSRPGSPAVAAADIGIAVGAVDDNGNIAGFTNLAGGQRDVLGDGNANMLYVTANGVSVYSTDANDLDGVISYQGTSMACPVVAGAVAVMLSADPTLTPDQIKVILANTSYDSYGEQRGF